MAVLRRAVRIIGRAANPVYRLTPRRKAALAKAVKASAAARRKSGRRAGLGAQIVRYGERVQGVSSVNRQATARVASMGLRKNSFGMAKSSQFRGRAGRAVRLSTYNDRLQAGRQAFRERSFAGRVGRNILGNRYDTLTFGENFRRNIARTVKVNVANSAITSTAVVGAGAAYGISQRSGDVMRQINRYKEDPNHRNTR